MLHVDGSSNASNGGAGILIQGPKRIDIEVAARLSFPATNNEAEYEALILGLELAHEAGARALEVYTDSQLVAMQIEGRYEAKERAMSMYLRKAKSWMERFDKCTVQQIPREENDKADSLSKFGALLSGAEYVLKEIHEGSCGNHSGARSVAQKDAKTLVQRCETCQKFSSRIHVPATPLEPWGIDILGPLPPAKAQKKFIILAVEYFSKWVEAEAVARISEKEMINFIWKNIICRFEIPREITSWLKELKIRQNFTSVGHPQSNGQTEVTNRTVMQYLKTRIKSKGSWDDELPGVLWAYRTTPRSSTGESPFCLVYGSEAIIPAEIDEETQMIAQYDPEENDQARAFDLTMIEEKRVAAYAKILHHKTLMMRQYYKTLRPRELQVGDLVLKKVEVSKHVGKLDPEWEGPYKVVEIRRKGSYILQDAKGRNLPRPWNIRNLRKFYA
ncbi:UNVERIFIED_CONTAM: Ribonuclease HI [Sesamum indicum]